MPFVVQFQESDGFYGYDGSFHLLAMGFIQTLLSFSFLSELDVSHCTLFFKMRIYPVFWSFWFLPSLFLIFYLVCMLHMVLQDMFDILLYPSVFLVSHSSVHIIITCNQLNSFLFKMIGSFISYVHLSQ